MLIHIGYHKTGTTWLQENVFKHLDDSELIYLFDRLQIRDDFIKVSPQYFDIEATKIKYKPIIENCQMRNLVPIISHERLSGYPSSGGYDSTLIADRLAAIFPEAKVLITIREQKSLILSWYAQYIVDGGSLNFESFINPPSTNCVVGMPLFDLKFYEFHHLIEYYQKLFSKENVLVLPFELLKDNPEEFSNRICSFANIPVPAYIAKEQKNLRKNFMEIYYLRICNKLFGYNNINLNPTFDFLPPKLLSYAKKFLIELFSVFIRRFIPNNIDDKVKQKYRKTISKFTKNLFLKSNNITSKLIDIELNNHDYDC